MHSVFHLHEHTPGQASGCCPVECDLDNRCALWLPWPTWDSEWWGLVLFKEEKIPPYFLSSATCPLPSPLPSPSREHPSSLTPPAFPHMLSGSCWWGHWPVDSGIAIPYKSKIPKCTGESEIICLCDKCFMSFHFRYSRKGCVSCGYSVNMAYKSTAHNAFLAPTDLFAHSVHHSMNF